MNVDRKLPFIVFFLLRIKFTYQYCSMSFPSHDRTLLFLGCVTDLDWEGWSYLLYSLHLWFFNFTESLNDSAQFGQGNDFFPVWTLIWIFKQFTRLNDLEHSEHLWGFSPVWIFIWILSTCGWLNDLVHSEHLYGFSPVWILIWILQPFACLNDLEHSKHL